MKAKFATLCSQCGDQIRPGKEISKDTSDKWVHKYCADESDELP